MFQLFYKKTDDFAIGFCLGLTVGALLANHEKRCGIEYLSTPIKLTTLTMSLLFADNADARFSRVGGCLTGLLGGWLLNFGLVYLVTRTPSFKA